MFRQKPTESDRVSNLFEMNTIRKSAENASEPITLSLPEPVEGAPALKPYRKQADIRPIRPVLLPFQPVEEDEAHEPEALQEAPASSHAVARLRNLYELKPAQKPSAEPVSETKKAPLSESPELQSRLRKTQLRLKTVQLLLRVSVPLADRLKEIAGLMSESFSLWQVQLHLPVAHRPEQLEVLGSYTRKGSNVPKASAEHAKALQKVFKEGRENNLKQSQSQHLLLPLQHRSDRLGVLEAVYSPAHNLSADDQLTLKSLVEEIAFYLSEERQHSHDLALSDKDSLTSILNHRAFMQRFETLLKDAKQLPLSLLIIDLDFFRQINEVHGYQQGDQVLQQIARLLLHHLGEELPLARFGGEEFAILLPETPLETALELAGGLRQAIASEKINGKFNSSLGITASLGVTSLSKTLPKARQQMIEQALTALANAKDKGRNQVQTYEPPREIPREPSTASRPAQSAAGPSRPSGSGQLKPVIKTSALPAAQPKPETSAQAAARPPIQSVTARKWSEILTERLEEIKEEWQQQSQDYGVPEVSQGVEQLSARLVRLVESLCGLLDQKLKIEDLEKMPLSYFMPSQLVADIRRGQAQLISYEVAFMLLQESLMAVLGKQGDSLQDGMDHFFLCINEKLTALKTELQKGRP